MNRAALPVHILFALLPGLLAAQEIRTIYVTIRIDDIFVREPSIQPQEVDGFVRTCEKHGAKVMLAVIPHRLVEDQNSNGEMAKAVKELVKRGHMVSMNSYNHRCSRCGSTDHEYFCTRDSVSLPYEFERRELAEGKEWLDAATGDTVTTFVGAGTDDQLQPQTLAILKTLGFRWTTNDSIHAPEFHDTLSFVPHPQDYTWELRDSTYSGLLEKAKSDFVSAIQRGNYFSFAAHDHFTRTNYNKGIVLRWTDEFLSYLDSFPHLAIHYVTINEFQKMWFAGARR